MSNYVHQCSNSRGEWKEKIVEHRWK
jgi:hypothetical protein